MLPLICLLMAVGTTAQAGEIYDTAGNVVFHTEDTGRTQEVVTIKGPRNYPDIALISHQSGRIYRFSQRWDQVTSAGQVILDYHFNKRRWRLVESQNISVGGRVNKELIQRSYTKQSARYRKGNSINTKSIYKTSEQGDYPILTFVAGNYVSEFGEVIYTLKGRFPDWASIVLLHHYYTETYLSGDLEEIQAKRALEADHFGNSNSIALDMLNLGHHYETVETRIFGGHYNIVYFTEIDGQTVNLEWGQVEQLKNQWLILNPKRRLNTRPFVMPEGGHYVKKKKAKKRGVMGVRSGSLVFEIKIKPEYQAEFRTAIFEPPASPSTD